MKNINKKRGDVQQKYAAVEPQHGHLTLPLRQPVGSSFNLHQWLRVPVQWSTSALDNIATACLINAASKNINCIDEAIVNETMAEFQLP